MSEQYIMIGNNSANVQGRRQLDLVFIVIRSSYVHTTLTYMHDSVVINTRMRITGRFKGYILSVDMANLSATG